MSLELLSQLLFESNELIFEKTSKLSLNKICGPKFLVKVHIPCGMLGNLSGKPKTVEDDHYFELL